MSKKLRNTDAVFHSWAHQQFPAAECGNVSYEGTRLYSYRACIANIIAPGVVAHTTQLWSVTTSGHQARARQASDHMRTVWCYNPGGSISSNRAVIMEKIDDLLRAADKKEFKKNGDETVLSKKRRLDNLGEARRLAEQFNEYLDYGPDTDVKPIVMPEDMEPMLEELRLRDEAAAAALEERRKKLEEEEAKRRAKDLEDAKGYIKLWREHKESEWEDRRPHLGSLPPLLRLSKDGEEVETSWGANIPVKDALRLWPIIQRVRRKEFAPEDLGVELKFPMKLGPFTLNVIKKDGSIKVGCHSIAFGEIEDIAIRLGLIVVKSNG